MLTEYAMRCAYLYEISKKEFELYHLTAPLNPVALRLVLRKHNESETVQEENDIMNRIAIGLSVLNSYLTTYATSYTILTRRTKYDK